LKRGNRRDATCGDAGCGRADQWNAENDCDETADKAGAEYQGSVHAYSAFASIAAFIASEADMFLKRCSGFWCGFQIKIGADGKKLSVKPGQAMNTVV
jgi:hypothetical protein